jgi:hypothetical protein
VTWIVRSEPSRCTVTSIVSPGSSSSIACATSSGSWTSSPSTSVMTSPGRMPASAAGPPAVASPTWAPPLSAGDV